MTNIPMVMAMVHGQILVKKMNHKRSSNGTMMITVLFVVGRRQLPLGVMHISVAHIYLKHMA